MSKHEPAEPQEAPSAEPQESPSVDILPKTAFREAMMARAHLIAAQAHASMGDSDEARAALIKSRAAILAHHRANATLEESRRFRKYQETGSIDDLLGLPPISGFER